MASVPGIFVPQAAKCLESAVTAYWKDLWRPGPETLQKEWSEKGSIACNYRMGEVKGLRRDPPSPVKIGGGRMNFLNCNILSM